MRGEPSTALEGVICTLNGRRLPGAFSYKFQLRRRGDSLTQRRKEKRKGERYERTTKGTKYTKVREKESRIESLSLLHTLFSCLSSFSWFTSSALRLLGDLCAFARCLTDSRRNNPVTAKGMRGKLAAEDASVSRYDADVRTEPRRRWIRFRLRTFSSPLPGPPQDYATAIGPRRGQVV
jgi:hypothetical protein